MLVFLNQVHCTRQKTSGYGQVKPSHNRALGYNPAKLPKNRSV